MLCLGVLISILGNTLPWCRCWHHLYSQWQLLALWSPQSVSLTCVACSYSRFIGTIPLWTARDTWRMPLQVCPLSYRCTCTSMRYVLCVSVFWVTVFIRCVHAYLCVCRWTMMKHYLLQPVCVWIFSGLICVYLWDWQMIVHLAVVLILHFLMCASSLPEGCPWATTCLCWSNIYQDLPESVFLLYIFNVTECELVFVVNVIHLLFV